MSKNVGAGGRFDIFLDSALSEYDKEPQGDTMKLLKVLLFIVSNSITPLIRSNIHINVL